MLLSDIINKRMGMRNKQESQNRKTPSIKLNIFKVAYAELLSRDELLQLVAHRLALVVRAVPVHDGGERRCVLPVDADVQAHQAVRAVPDLLERHRCIPLRTALQLVEKVRNYLRQRKLWNWCPSKTTRKKIKNKSKYHKRKKL